MESEEVADVGNGELPPETLEAPAEEEIVITDMNATQIHDEISKRIQYAKLEFYRAANASSNDLVLENIHRLKGAIFALTSVKLFLEQRNPSVSAWSDPLS